MSFWYKLNHILDTDLSRPIGWKLRVFLLAVLLVMAISQIKSCHGF